MTSYRKKCTVPLPCSVCAFLGTKCRGVRVRDQDLKPAIDCDYRMPPAAMGAAAW